MNEKTKAVTVPQKGIPPWVFILGGLALMAALSSTSKTVRTVATQAATKAATTVKQAATTAIAKVKSAVNWMQWTESQKLDSLNPEFRKKVEKVILDLKSQGYKPRIDYGWRDLAYQQELVKKGASKTTFSWHNVTTDKGEPAALAVDFIDNSVFKNKKWDDNAKFWEDLGKAARKQGLVWGGDWKNFKDRPHVQMYPDTQLASYKTKTLKALAVA
jgi:peptidoglycan L-alanyl-D-glutamate endopeptidase CwlK